MTESLQRVLRADHSLTLFLLKQAYWKLFPERTNKSIKSCRNLTSGNEIILLN